MSISVKQMRHALALAATGSFTAAAQRSNVSQSALSRSIEKMEAQLGVSLFNRDVGAVTPTIYGEAVLTGASEVDRKIEEIQRHIDELRGVVRGHFHVALGVYPAEIIGHRAIGLMSRRFPELTMRAEVCNWQEVNRRVLTGQVELAYAVANQALSEPRLEVEPLIGHELAYYARASHPLAKNDTVSDAQLDDYPLISIRVPADLATTIHGKSTLDAETGYLIPALEIDDFTVARGVVRSSDAIGVTTPLQIARDLEGGEFVLLRYPRPWIAPRYGFIQKRGFFVSPAARKFRELVREVEQEAQAQNRRLLDKYLPLD